MRDSKTRRAVDHEKTIERELRDAYKDASFNTMWCMYEKFGQKIFTWDACRFSVMRRMMIETYPTLYYEKIRS